MRDGSSYEGDFVDGEIEGKGVRRWPDRSEYVGDFHLGEFHGKGNTPLRLVPVPVYQGAQWPLRCL